MRFGHRQDPFYHRLVWLSTFLLIYFVDLLRFSTLSSGPSSQITQLCLSDFHVHQLFSFSQFVSFLPGFAQRIMLATVSYSTVHNTSSRTNLSYHIVSHDDHLLAEYLATHLTSLLRPWMLKCLPLNCEHWRSRKSVEPGGQSFNNTVIHHTPSRQVHSLQMTHIYWSEGSYHTVYHTQPSARRINCRLHSHSVITILLM